MRANHAARFLHVLQFDALGYRRGQGGIRGQPGGLGNQLPHSGFRQGGIALVGNRTDGGDQLETVALREMQGYPLGAHAIGILPPHGCHRGRAGGNRGRGPRIPGAAGTSAKRRQQRQAGQEQGKDFGMFHLTRPPLLV